MRLVLVVLLTTTVMAGTSVGASDRTQESGEKAIVAGLKGSQYTLADVRQWLEKLDPAERYTAKQRLGEFVEERVRREVLAREARRLGLDQEPEVQAQLQQASRTILARALIRREVIDQAQPSEQAVKEYYRQNKADFAVPERVEVKEAQVADESAAIAIRAAVEGGRTFEEAANAQGAARIIQATIERGMHGRAVEQKIFTLQPGEVSEPVPNSNVFSVFLVQARHPAEAQPLDAVRAAIESRLAARNRERLMDALKDRLWNAEQVEIRNDLLEAAAPLDK